MAAADNVQAGRLFVGLVRFPPGETTQPWTAPPGHWNLSYTLGGRVHEILPDGETWQEPGDLMVLKPGGSHHWGVPADASEPWHVVYFVFVPPPTWLPLLDLPEEFAAFTRLPLAGREVDGRIRAALEDAHRLAAVPEVGEPLAMNALERALLWLQADRRDEDPRLRRAMDIFTRRLADPPTVPEVAAACGLSPSRFGQLFREHTGLSPAAWQERARLDHARKLLLTTGLPVKLVAAACGYADQRYFATRFRRHFQTTPTQCRKTARGLHWQR